MVSILGWTNTTYPITFDPNFQQGRLQDMPPVIQADGVLWMAHSFSTLSSLKDELEIGAPNETNPWVV